jgi:hypothetical protein
MKIRGLFMILGILFFSAMAYSQMPPPGYERAVKMKQAQESIPKMDRDSVTLVDTTEIYDPTTDESEIKIIVSRYSLRDYCRQYLGMNDPEILLDQQPHTILDPKTYEDLTIRLNSSGKIDTIPK